MPETKLSWKLSRVEAPELTGAALRIAGFDLGKRPEFATAANVSGVRGRAFTFSQRRDSRTIFASNSRYGLRQKGGVWTGQDRLAVASCRRLLRAARIPVAEIADIKVMSEFGATGQRLSSKENRVGKPELLRKIVRARRAVDGLPVWSSYAIVGLTRDRSVGSLELHWPYLTPTILKEAAVLRSAVDHGFKPRSLQGARVESVAAGIVHSPAIGFFMDVSAAIRVVYAGEDPTAGRKPTLYFDRHGDLISPPRDVLPATPENKVRATQGKPRTASR